MNDRKFKCKDEELPVIAGFILTSFKRDLVDFTALSPKFNEEYISTLESLIEASFKLVAPEEETVQLKLITRRLYGTMKELFKPLDKLEIYLSMANGQIGLSPKDFGISDARKAIHTRDAERLLEALNRINHQLSRYNEALTAQGLTAEQTTLFSTVVAQIKTDNQLQQEIVSNRSQLVLDNVEQLNGLFSELMLICKTGKALYRNNSPAKVADYTYGQVKKAVRYQAKAKEEEPA